MTEAGICMVEECVKCGIGGETVAEAEELLLHDWGGKLRSSLSEQKRTCSELPSPCLAWRVENWLSFFTTFHFFEY